MNALLISIITSPSSRQKFSILTVIFSRARFQARCSARSWFCVSLYASITCFQAELATHNILHLLVRTTGELYLYNNVLTGTIPNEIGTPVLFRKFRISRFLCKFESGTSLSTPSSLSGSIYLDGNQFSGPLPGMHTSRYFVSVFRFVF